MANFGDIQSDLIITSRQVPIRNDGDSAFTVYTPPQITIGGNTSGATAVISSGSIQLAGGNNITLSQNGNSLTIVGGAGGAAGSNTLGISNLGNTSGTSGVISGSALQFALAGGNNVTLSQSINGASATITISAANQTVQTQNLVSVQGSTGAISFADSNGITFGGNASTITASHNGLTSQSNQVLSGSNGSFAFQTATFGNLNGMSFYTSNGSMVGSYTVPTQTTQTYNVLAAGAQTANSTGTVAFSNSNGITFGMSNSSVITASHNGITSQTVQTQNMVSVLGSTGNISFANGNGVTFGGNASTVTASHNGITSQTNQTIGAYAVSNSTQSTSGTIDARSLSFNGAGGVSVGISNGSIVISGGTGGAGDGYNIIAAGTQTAATTGTIVFSNSNNISFGMSNSSVVTASYSPTAATMYVPYNGSFGFLAIGQANLFMMPLRAPSMTIDRVNVYNQLTVSSNSTGTMTASWWAGVYTNNAGTLSLLNSGSLSNALTYSGNNANSSTFAGPRIMSIPLAATLTDVNYYLGIVSRTTTGGNNATFQNMVLSQGNSAFSGSFGQATATSMQFLKGFGIYSATTSAMPTSIGFSQISGAGVAIFRSQPYVVLQSGA